MVVIRGVIVMRKIIFLIMVILVQSASMLCGQTTIQFAGQTWDVRSGTGNPGNNNWSDSSESVWVDDSGYLHLKIRKSGDRWYCSEIVSQKSFGYGEYIFYVASNVEKYDQNVVAAMFTYENDKREIDIEFTGSGFGNTSKMNTYGWYTVQPKPYNDTNQKLFKLNLTDNYSSHKFIWSSENIFFQSYHGHYPQLPSGDYLIQEWTYIGSKNPPAGKERLHINLYLLGGEPPTDGQEVEFVVNAVFIPVGSLKVTLSPVAAVDAGAMWRIDNGEWQNNGVSLERLSNCAHTLSFKPSPGWFTPQDSTVIIVEGLLNVDIEYHLNTGNESVLENEPKIFPNPVSEKLHVEFPSDRIIREIIIIDISGRIIYSVKNCNTTCEIDVSDLFPGIYHLRVGTDRGLYIQKLVITR